MKHRYSTRQIIVGALTLGAGLAGLTTAWPHAASAGTEWAVAEARRVDAPGRQAFADGHISRHEYDAAFDRTVACLRSSGLAPIETTAPYGMPLRRYAVPSESDEELARVDTAIERCGSPLRPIEAAFVAETAPAPGSRTRRDAERPALRCLGAPDQALIGDAATAAVRRGDPRAPDCIARFQAEAPTPVPGADQIAAVLANQ